MMGGEPFYPVVNNELIIDTTKLYVTNQDLVFDFKNLNIHIPYKNSIVNLEEHTRTYGNSNEYRYYKIINDTNDNIAKDIYNKYIYGFFNRFIDITNKDNDNEFKPTFMNMYNSRSHSSVVDDTLSVYGFGLNFNSGIFCYMYHSKLIYGFGYIV